MERRENQTFFGDNCHISDDFSCNRLQGTLNPVSTGVSSKGCVNTASWCLDGSTTPIAVDISSNFTSTCIYLLTAASTLLVSGFPTDFGT